MYYTLTYHLIKSDGALEFFHASIMKNYLHLNFAPLY